MFSDSVILNAHSILLLCSALVKCIIAQDLSTLFTGKVCYVISWPIVHKKSEVKRYQTTYKNQSEELGDKEMEKHYATLHGTVG